MSKDDNPVLASKEFGSSRNSIVLFMDDANSLAKPNAVLQSKAIRGQMCVTPSIDQNKNLIERFSAPAFSMPELPRTLPSGMLPATKAYQTALGVICQLRAQILR